MRDDFLSADWAHSHHRLTDAIGALLRTISVALARLNAIQYDAPWKHDPAVGGMAGRR
jgi:hypothetical protein